MQGSANKGTLESRTPLQDSANKGTLESDTSERLQLGLMGMAAAGLAAHFVHSRQVWQMDGWV